MCLVSNLIRIQESTDDNDKKDEQTNNDGLLRDLDPWHLYMTAKGMVIEKDHNGLSKYSLNCEKPNYIKEKGAKCNQFWEFDPWINSELDKL